MGSGLIDKLVSFIGSEVDPKTVVKIEAEERGPHHSYPKRNQGVH
jgi:hypothetical protein